jgi:hypothetical protein
MISLWEPKTENRLVGRRRLEAEFGMGELLTAGSSARDGDTSSAVPARAVPGAVVEVRWSRDVFWSKKIAISKRGNL